MHFLKILLVADFILYKLTGQFITDFSNASRTMLFDINNLKYSDNITAELEIDLDKMPSALESGVDIGEIVTDETDFDKKTLVVHLISPGATTPTPKAADC